jgi:hypothetical protein
MTSATHNQKPLRLFYVYSHEDERLLGKLKTALALLRRQGLIQEWHDREISAGQEWQGEINKQLEAANIILLLISPDLIASDYCYDIEIKRAVARHREGTARVVPVIIRMVPDAWRNTELGTLQALPKDGRAVASWTDKDAAWLDIEKGIRGVIQEVQRLRHRSGPPPDDGPISPCYALVQVDASQEVTRWFLRLGEEMLIGRHEEADIRLPEGDKKASRNHCKICWSSKDVVEVVDQSSHNGTFVNEQQVNQARLQLGDHLRCGHTVFRLEDYNATESEDSDEQ